MITVVTKPFEADGYQLTSGQVVDSTTWRNESRLINCRFLREATESEVADFKKSPPKRATKAKAKSKTKAKAKGAAKPKASTVVKTTAAPAKKKKRAPKPTPAGPVAPARSPEDSGLSI